MHTVEPAVNLYFQTYLISGPGKTVGLVWVCLSISLRVFGQLR